MKPKPWLLLATMLALSTPVSASLYTIAIDGPYLDLSGYIVTDTVGTYAPDQFDSLTTDYSITASLNGAYPFTFTRENSNWGQRLQLSGEHYGDWLNVTVTPDQLTISSWYGLWDCAGNCFLIADGTVNGRYFPNLSISDDIISYFPGWSSYRVPDLLPGDGLTFLDPPVALPIPSSVWLLGAGLVWMVWRSRQKLKLH